MITITKLVKSATFQTVSAVSDFGFSFTAIIESQRSKENNVQGGMVSHLVVVDDSSGRVVFDFSDGATNFMDEIVCENIIKLWILELTSEVILHKINWDIAPDAGHREDVPTLYNQMAWNATTH